MFTCRCIKAVFKDSDLWHIKLHVLCRTALHWACKRGHVSIVQVLLQNGADVNIVNFKGELASELTTSVEVLAAMKMEPGDDFAKRCSEGAGKLPIVPNYLRNPVFPYSAHDDDYDGELSSTTTACSGQHSINKLISLSEEGPSIKSFVTSTTSDSGKSLASEADATATSPLILRVRKSGNKDSDFVEVELPSLTYSSLLKSCCEELEVELQDVAKIRKLPNIWVRKDKDVQRLKEGQELEIILNTD